MNASSSPDLAETYADVLRGFGLTRSEIGEPHADEGPLTAETIRWDVNLEEADQAYELLRGTLVRSDRGIEAPRRYWSQAPAFQLNDVLAAFGYEVAFEAPGGGAFESADEAFDVVLFEDGTEHDRVTFGYPDGPLGEDNYPALVHAVRTRLLDDHDFAFVLLSEPEDAWRFVLVEESDLERPRSEYGPRVEVFGRPLLSEDQPVDYFENSGIVDPEGVDDGDTGGFVGGLDSVVAASGIDDVFESIEREAATEPVAPTRETPGDLDEDVQALITNSEGPAGVASPTVRDVSDDRLDAVVDRFEADPTDVEDASARLRAVEKTGSGTDGEAGRGDAEQPASGTDVPDSTELEDGHVTAPSRGGPRGGGLSQQVAEALYSEDEGEPTTAGESGPGLDWDRAGRDGPATGPRVESDDDSSPPGSDRGDDTEPVDYPTRNRSDPTDEEPRSGREPDRTSETPESVEEPAPDTSFGDDSDGTSSAPEVVGPVVNEDDEDERDDDGSRGALEQLSETVRNLL